MPIRVLIADDHVVLRKGLQFMVQECFDLEIVGEARNGVEALVMAEALMPDVMVLDLMMPRLNGLEVTQTLKRQSFKTEVVVFSMHNDIGYVVRALRTGALGYVLKDAPAQELIDAIRAAAAHRSYICSALANLVPASAMYEVEKAGAGPLEMLTPREQQIFLLAAQGMTSEEIGHRLDISRRTVECHRYHMGRKLKLKKPIDLVKMAVEYGLIAADGL